MEVMAMKAGCNAVRVAGSRTPTTAGRVDRLTGLLQDWAAWCRSYKYQSGFSPMAGTGGGATSKTFEDLCVECDAAVNRAVDAAVDDLLPAQHAAVLRHYELAAVFRFPRDNYQQQLDQAHDALRQSLPRRGVMLDF